MNVNPEHDSQRNARPQPTALPSERTIRRQLLSDAVQHPATLLPLAGAAACVVYLLLLSPVFGNGAWETLVLLACGIAAAASFAWRFVFRYADEYAASERQMLMLQDLELARRGQQEVSERLAFLESGLSGIGSDEGLTALNELVGEYEKLQPALERQTDSDPLSMARVPVLAEETYRLGLNLLSDALELLDAGQSTGRESLEKEVAELETAVQVARGDEEQPERLKIKEDTLAARRQFLDLLDQLQLRVEQLLFQVNRCEASLHRTRIELARIRTGGSEASVDSVIIALQGTLSQGKEVQEELKKLGY